VAELVASRRPTVLVVSGDLTQRAKPAQFAAARQFLAALDLPQVVVPGNHDVPLYRVWERALTPFGAYRRHFDSRLEPVHADAELVIAGINTAFNWTTKYGRIRPRRLAEIAEVVGAAESGALRVIVAHHPVVTAPEFEGEPAMRRAERAARAFSRMGIDLVLSGHVHLSFFGHSRDFFPHLSPPFRVLHAGTATSSRGRGSERLVNSCNWLEVTDGEVSVERLVWDPRSATFEPSSRLAWQRSAHPEGE
jgi:3',5'-cyclic AMP phosphodiesterase CpdA